MPELPEVETTSQRLHKYIQGKQIKSSSVFWKRTLSDISLQQFNQHSKGYTIQSVSRRAKYIVITLQKSEITKYISIHLRMTGKVRFDTNPQKLKHDRLQISFQDGSAFTLEDVRKFGKVCLFEDFDQFFSHIGPEPFDKELNPKKFFAMLSKRRTKLKPLLLNQGFIAGLGNIYVDESLWASKLHPNLTADKVTAEQSKELLKNIRRILKQAIAKGGTDYGDGVIEFGFFNPKVYGRKEEPCKRCKSKVERIVVAQRGTHICPKCQKL